MYHQAQYMYDKLTILVDTQTEKVVFSKDLHDELSAAVRQFQQDLERHDNRAMTEQPTTLPHPPLVSQPERSQE